MRICTGDAYGQRGPGTVLFKEGIKRQEKNRFKAACRFGNAGMHGKVKRFRNHVVRTPASCDRAGIVQRPGLSGSSSRRKILTKQGSILKDRGGEAE